MRTILAIFIALLVPSMMAACGGPAPCDPATGNCNTGGGGSGGGGTCDVTSCPQGNDCQVALCTAATGCGLSNKDDDAPCGVDGKLQCKAGLCQGCTDATQCTAVECNATTCDGGTCKNTPDASLTCAEGKGSCDDKGVCSRCDDGKQNGQETAVDCGGICGKCAAETCADASECASGTCSGGVCCDVACDGGCMACTKDMTGLADGMCGPILPDKPTACDTKGGCSDGGYCRCEDGVKNGDETDQDCGGSCGETCGDAAKCSVAKDCLSQLCVDGVCCNKACEGPCLACNSAETPGLCFPVMAGATDMQCTGTQVCGVAGACAEPAGEACAQDTECASALCAAQKCAVCAKDADCGADRVCTGGACYPKADIGQPCKSATACNSGFCVDGVCCETACEGLCMGCQNNYTAKSDGTCAPIFGPAQGVNAFYDPRNDCPDGLPGGASYCSGAPADMNGNSTCGGMK